MKKFDTLNDAQKESAVEFFYNSIINDACRDELVLCLDTEEMTDVFTEMLDETSDLAEKLLTPWFMNEMLSEKVKGDKKVYENILRIAKQKAMISFYREYGDVVVSL